ncbi:MAG: hypothetical protein KDI90_11625 [Alphaproteobacteria bacterium]|nr:hypothetical protein [Alphaproteobacteria bacterium]MCB9974203.1 hypothetical protein [Rhodospirillales bacterium]
MFVLKNVKITLLTLTLILTMSVPAFAVKKNDRDSQGYDLVFMPILKKEVIIIDNDSNPPGEPNIVEITFLKDVPPRGLLDRANRLIYGITTDIPPEYDQYGYEIRRYMASVGNMKVFTDEDFLEEQIKNTRKARVIARFWQKYIEEEIDELEKLVNEKDSSSSVWTALKQNRQITRTFIIDLQGWIDSNERLLMKIFDSFGFIQVEYPELIFMRPHERVDFFNTLQTRQAKLNAIKKYQAFALMSY